MSDDPDETMARLRRRAAELRRGDHEAFDLGADASESAFGTDVPAGDAEQAPTGTGARGGPTPAEDALDGRDAGVPAPGADEPGPTTTDPTVDPTRSSEASDGTGDPGVDAVIEAPPRSRPRHAGAPPPPPPGPEVPSTAVGPGRPEAPSRPARRDPDIPAVTDDGNDDGFGPADARSTVPGATDGDILTRWADEEQLTSVEPRRNWSGAVAVLVIVAVLAVAGLGGAALLRSGGGGEGARGEGSEGADDVASILAEDAPSLEDLTSDVTLPPGPPTGLEVVDEGVTVVEDRFDATRRESTYAVLIENPHPDWLAQGVQVRVNMIGEGGITLATDQGFVEVVLPDQTVAVAALVFDAPVEAVIDLDVSIEVARWRRTTAFEGRFDVSDITNREAEFSGIVTQAMIRSTFVEPLTDVVVTAIHRDANGAIVGGADTFVELLEPGVPTPVEISLLANVALDQVVETTLYPTATFGFSPDEGG